MASGDDESNEESDEESEEPANVSGIYISSQWLMYDEKSNGLGD
jgi:hypothetical protein